MAAAEAQNPAKSIVLFSDGTGNSSAKLFKTNVFRLYEAVDLGPTQAGRQRQIAFYDNGVGTSAFRPLRMLQGAFGFGLKRNVLEIYSYACRNYDPDSAPLDGSGITDRGDHIYGFGFSRGAFTMRLVVGLIADQGLIPYKDERDLEWKVRAAWKTFRRKWPRSIERALRFLGLREEPPVLAAAELQVAKGTVTESRHYDPSSNHRPLIRFIGVWDTVAAYGGPVTEITRAIDNFIYRLSMPNYELHPRVRRARHALALDDARDSFQPLLWDAFAEAQLRKKYAEEEAPWLHAGRLDQVWFAGMHADVGGGYPDESLSYVSLLWMLEQAHECGLRTVDHITDRYHGLANSFGPLHNSRAGMAGYYRYQPRRIETWMNVNPVRTLSLRDPAIRAERSPEAYREIVEGRIVDERPWGLINNARVHVSVIARIASGTDGYAPIVLPEDYSVVPEGGLAETKLLETSGGKPPLTPEQLEQARSGARPLVSRAVLDWLARPNAKRNVARDLEAAWDLVWWRRLVYFLTVLSTLALFALPWWILPEIEKVGGGDVGIWQLPIVAAGFEAVGNLLRMIGGLLPGFLDRWITAWAANPGWFLIFLLLILVLMAAGQRLERKISDVARSAWHRVIPRIPPATAGRPPEDHEPLGESGFARFRNGRGYQRAMQLFKWLVLPNFLFAPIMAATLLWLAHAVVLQLSLPFIEAQAFCRTGGATVEITQAYSEFSTAASCNAANGSVTAGESYTITFDVTQSWSDEEYESTPAGIAAGDMRWGIGYLAAPFRRAIGSRYMQPIAAVRTRGQSGEFRFVRLRPLEMIPSEESPNRYQAEFEAPASGELFLFVNEAVLLFDIDGLYNNNQGAARVTVVSASYAAKEDGFWRHLLDAIAAAAGRGRA